MLFISYMYHCTDHLQAKCSVHLKAELHVLTCTRCQTMDGVVSHCRICKRYDEMADKVSDIPDATKELVNTQTYLRQVKTLSLARGVV